MSFEFKDYHFGLKNPLFFSSFVFISNIIVAYYVNEPIYFILFSILLMTSLIVHYSQNTFISYCDKFCIGLIVLYGFIIFSMKVLHIKTIYQLISSIIVIFLFLSCIFIYQNYALKTVTLFNIEGNFYHILIHLSGAIGHNLIMLL